MRQRGGEDAAWAWCGCGCGWWGLTLRGQAQVRNEGRGVSEKVYKSRPETITDHTPPPRHTVPITLPSPPLPCKSTPATPGQRVAITHHTHTTGVAESCFSLLRRRTAKCAPANQPASLLVKVAWASARARRASSVSRARAADAAVGLSKRAAHRPTATTWAGGAVLDAGCAGGPLEEKEEARSLANYNNRRTLSERILPWMHQPTPESMSRRVGFPLRQRREEECQWNVASHTASLDLFAPFPPSPSPPIPLVSHLFSR